MSKKSLLFSLVAVLMVAGSGSAATITYEFSKLTNNNLENIGTQLSVAVSDDGLLPGQVSFTFWNDVGIPASITEIYFADGTLLGIASITQSSGVTFSQSSRLTPPNLPGGDTLAVPFVATQAFSLDMGQVTANGVNTGLEWVTITFDLLDGQTYWDTIAALGDGSLRIGVHARAIGEAGGSDAYLVPDGGTTLTLLGVALVGLGVLRRRLAR
jgi:hypothetical protein